MRTPARALGFLLILTAFLLACTPAPSGNPQTPAPTAEGPDADWQRILQAARQEGVVSVIGPAAPQNREALTEPFMRQYPDITVHYESGPPAQLPPKLLAERAAGQYLADVVIVGTTTLLSSLKPAGVLARIQPHLVGPETRNPSIWRGGSFTFADEEEAFAFVFGTYVKSPFLYNTAAVQPGEIKSWRDLLDPKWRGKMAMYDPRLAGGGNSIATYWYTSESLGKDYIRDMFTTQGVAVSRDERQILDWVARGQYLVGIGVGDVQAIDMMRRGLPIRAKEPDSLLEVPYVTSGTGTVAVIDRAPHPNALKVYLDFLLSRDGQLAWSHAAGVASDRLDVPRDHVEGLLIPREGQVYERQFTESFVRLREEVEGFLRTVLPL